MTTHRKPTGRSFRIARDERGAVLLLVVLGMLGFVAIVAFAVDLGMLYVTRNESQNVADGAALAAASILITAPGNQAAARAEAKKFAAKNYVRGEPVTLEDEDIVFFPSNEDKVRVWVRHCATDCGDPGVTPRGNAIPTIFARVFGKDVTDVVTMAAAEAFPAGGASCMIPIVLPDRWLEYQWNDPDGELDCKQNSGDCIDRFDSQDDEPGISDDEYVPWKDPVTGQTNQDFTGYSEDDYGLQIRIRQPQGSGGGEINPSWYLHWVFPDDRGGDAFRDAWTECDPSLTVAIGDEVNTEPGNEVGPLRQGAEALIAQDETFWDPDQSCPVLQLGGPCHLGSPRVRPMPMFDPESESDMGSGRKLFTISNIASVYIADINGTEITAYFLGYGGTAAPEVPGETLPPLFKFPRLVE